MSTLQARRFAFRISPLDWRGRTNARAQLAASGKLAASKSSMAIRVRRRYTTARRARRPHGCKPTAPVVRNQRITVTSDVWTVSAPRLFLRNHFAFDDSTGRLRLPLHPFAQLRAQISRLPPQISANDQHDCQTDRDEYQRNQESACQHHGAAQNNQRL